VSEEPHFGGAARSMRLLVAFGIGIAFALGPGAAAGASSSAWWSQAPPMLQARAAHAVVSSGDALIADDCAG
jgi:hypothetical protein